MNNEKIMQKVVFYFPWKELSGGPYYLCNLADELAKNKNYEVYYVDYDLGLSDKILSNNSVKKIIFKEEGDLPILSKEAVILVTPIYWANVIPKICNNSKILFVNWHNLCIPVLKRDSAISNKNLKRFLKLVKNTNSVFFLDQAHWEAQNSYNIVFKENYVPPSIKEKNISATCSLINKEEINIGVLGRLCADKIYSIINLLDNLDKIYGDIKKNVYIIGDGDMKSLIEPAKYKNNLFIHLKGIISGSKLNEFLVDNIDILFGMGISVLEGAALKLPSVIIPHSMDPIYCNKFVYLNKAKGFCLGWYEEQIERLSIENLELKNVIDDIYKNGLKEKIGKDCFDYYKSHHVTEKSILLFEKILNSTELKYGRFSKFFSFSRYKRIKKIRIFGIGIIDVLKNRNGKVRIDILRVPLAKISNIKNSSSKRLSIFGIPIFKIKVEGTNVRINSLFFN